jgi:formylglycine-generating enzyme required for sulfatase activity
MADGGPTVDNLNIMRRYSTTPLLAFAFGLALWLVAPRGLAQTNLALSVQLYAGLTITGEVGTSWQIQYTTDLSQTNAWVPLTNLTLTSSPQLWLDTTAPATANRFYRAATVLTNLIWIPPGTFVMGSPTSEAERDSNESQHRVTLTHGFYMGQYPVTQGEYQSVVGGNPSYFTTRDYYGNPISPDTNRPVEQVSWADATNYCVQLTQQELAAGRLPQGYVYRLPTESEWEYACRAGTTNAFYYTNALHGGMANFYDYYEYDASFGDIPIPNPTVPWRARTTAVGSYQTNAFGLYDMCGNVWEWCQDWYAAYPAGSVTNPPVPASGSMRISRGGSWGNFGVDCRSAKRGYYVPSYSNYTVGFRVVLAPAPP